MLSYNQWEKLQENNRWSQEEEDRLSQIAVQLASKYASEDPDATISSLMDKIAAHFQAQGIQNVDEYMDVIQDAAYDAWSKGNGPKNLSKGLDDLDRWRYEKNMMVRHSH